LSLLIYHLSSHISSIKDIATCPSYHNMLSTVMPMTRPQALYSLLDKESPRSRPPPADTLHNRTRTRTRLPHREHLIKARLSLRCQSSPSIPESAEDTIYDFMKPTAKDRETEEKAMRQLDLSRASANAFSEGGVIAYKPTEFRP